ncbi:MAG: tetratricopeptide repeat protein [Nitrospira sp.]
MAQSLHAEAIDELKKFMALDPSSPQRADAKLKLGIAQVRLKNYDQARETFSVLTEDQGSRTDEATVWLARVYLRQGLGEKLLDLCRTLSRRILTPEQKGQVNLFAGIWLEDQSRFDEAAERYRHVAKMGEPASQRTEAQWREGWLLYRTDRQREAIRVWQQIVDQKDSDVEPQALYWIARAHGQLGDAKAKDLFAQLCQRFPYTYYCQMAREQEEASFPHGWNRIRRRHQCWPSNPFLRPVTGWLRRTRSSIGVRSNNNQPSSERWSCGCWVGSRMPQES